MKNSEEQCGISLVEFWEIRVKPIAHGMDSLLHVFLRNTNTLTRLYRCRVRDHARHSTDVYNPISFESVAVEELHDEDRNTMELMEENLEEVHPTDSQIVFED